MRILIFVLFSLWSVHVQAQRPGFDHLAEKIVHEPNPFSFIMFNPSVDLSLEDFSIEGKENVLIPGSFQWGRVGNGKDEAGIIIPRARMRENGEETEVALTQVDNPIKVRFTPRKELKTHYYFDSSCSPFHLKINDAHLDHSWVMITCHRIYNGSDLGLAAKPVVVTTVLWENEKKGTLTTFNMDSDHPKKLFTGNGDDSFELEASIPPVFHHFGMSAGIGPYSSRNEVKPFATVYASYYLNDAFKVVGFGALPIRSNPELDFGSYLMLEQFRGLDERISLNLLIGAHLLSYVPPTGVRTSAMSGPQGIELTIRDLFIRNMNFLFGGFFLPKIDERYYVNAWVRYGTNQFFAELNFIEWQEPKPYFYSKSFGLSIGFPLFRAL